MRTQSDDDGETLGKVNGDYVADLQLPATSQRVPAQIEPDYNKKSSHTSRFHGWRCFGFYFFTNCIILSMKRDLMLQFSYARTWFCVVVFEWKASVLFQTVASNLSGVHDMVIGWYIGRHSVRVCVTAQSRCSLCVFCTVSVAALCSDAAAVWGGEANNNSAVVGQCVARAWVWRDISDIMSDIIREIICDIIASCSHWPQDQLSSHNLDG